MSQNASSNGAHSTGAHSTGAHSTGAHSTGAHSTEIGSIGSKSIDVMIEQDVWITCNVDRGGNVSIVRHRYLPGPDDQLIEVSDIVFESHHETQREKQQAREARLPDFIRRNELISA